MTSLATWQARAKPGEQFEYHRGFLAMDVTFAADSGVSDIRKEAVAAYLSGWYELAQTRIGPRGFSYLIVKRAARDTEPRTWYQIERFERLRRHRPLRAA